ncbi:hypothetical protein Cgig2_019127 [Carnegiea gigantea]|uniref:Uncharacterized protein n=1 Tax=Carnegiea gigantea TaxID=171969 RepID=A0A9Q1JTC1_9CARY|nr:hypothetical protein Cgig2_019127 [Carnegiea gigantea]
MEADLEPPTADQCLSPLSQSPSQGGDDCHDYGDDSNCSTPFVSAPSSPGRSFHYPAGVGFFYSAPASPMHYVLATAPARSTSAVLTPSASDASSNASGSFEFEFSARFDDSPAPEIGSSMSSADELFLNGQIRPMKLSAHLQRPQTLAPLIDLAEDEVEDAEDDQDVFQRARDLRLRNRSLRRRTRSLSPLRTTPPFDWFAGDDALSTPKNDAAAEERENGSAVGDQKGKEGETTPSGSASSSRCSSAGRSSKRWVFLKDFLRSKSEGRSNNKFWHNISFSPAKEKKEKKEPPVKKTPAPAVGKTPAPAKRRSAHEVHYTAKRAQAEEMRKKTFLPYRQGLLGCLGFNSKSYGALNGFARALNPVSSSASKQHFLSGHPSSTVLYCHL